MSASRGDRKRPVQRRRTSRRIHADWRYRALDRSGKWFEDTVENCLIEIMSEEEAIALQSYLALNHFQVTYAPNQPGWYLPEMDWHLLGGVGCLCN